MAPASVTALVRAFVAVGLVMGVRLLKLGWLCSLRLSFLGVEPSSKIC
ncbi:hypothetical protein [Pseudofrankia asymbiotica]|nr:hypothetical protein [Pseudofrankia asymbiotica]